ncbi:MAG: ABC transporter [Acidimicrobiales bacterium]|nr:MAG: ABC transporter [Acidimicrobiales bacterium]
MGDPAVVVEGVSKRFRVYHERQHTLKATLLTGRRSVHEDFWALDDVSFEVPRGCTFGLIGENGSGKSTLLKCMARILVPDRGRIVVDGRLSALLELGAGFHPELTGRENVYLNGSILGLSKREIDRRFDEIVTFAGAEVARFIDTPVKNYSSGMFVRLGFAIAINVEPEILLVDEILAVGDEAFQHRCTQKFASLRASGVTIVLVTHSLDAVRTICDRAAWLHHGRLMEVGLAGRVVESYLDAVRSHRREEEERAGAGTPKPETAGETVFRGAVLLNEHGEEITVARTGEPATLRLFLDLPTDSHKPVLRLELHRADGLMVSAESTRGSGITLAGRAGPTVVDYHMERVLLGTGTYDVSAILKDREGDVARRAKLLRFDVGNGNLIHHGGVVLLGGYWSVKAESSGISDAAAS